jgi:hypothetical protein
VKGHEKIELLSLRSVKDSNENTHLGSASMFLSSVT